MTNSMKTVWGIRALGCFFVSPYAENDETGKIIFGDKQDIQSRHFSKFNIGIRHLLRGTYEGSVESRTHQPVAGGKLFR